MKTEKDKIIEEIVEEYKRKHLIATYVNTDTNFCCYDNGYWDIEEILNKALQSQKQKIIKEIKKWWYKQKEGDVDEFDVGYVKIYWDDIKELLKSINSQQFEAKKDDKALSSCHLGARTNTDKATINRKKGSVDGDNQLPADINNQREKDGTK